MNDGKPSDLDWPKAIERPLLHPPRPGLSKNARKPSDLEDDILGSFYIIEITLRFFRNEIMVMA